MSLFFSIFYIFPFKENIFKLLLQVYFAIVFGLMAAWFCFPYRVIVTEKHFFVLRFGIRLNSYPRKNIQKIETSRCVGIDILTFNFDLENTVLPKWYPKNKQVTIPIWGNNSQKLQNALLLEPNNTHATPVEKMPGIKKNNLITILIALFFAGFIPIVLITLYVSISFVN